MMAIKMVSHRSDDGIGTGYARVVLPELILYSGASKYVSLKFQNKLRTLCEIASYE